MLTNYHHQFCIRLDFLGQMWYPKNHKSNKPAIGEQAMTYFSNIA